MTGSGTGRDDDGRGRGSGVGRSVFTVPRVTAGLATALLLVSGVVVACSSGDADPAAEPDEPTSSVAGSPSPSEEPSPAPYLDVPGVELTEPGSELSYGQEATVAWRPRDRVVGGLDVKVLRVERVPLRVFQGWRLDEQARASTAYFVRARVENVGQTDLSGVAVPLYAVDGQDRLVQASSFASSFRPCPSTPLPRRFTTDESTQACLVYLVPDEGELTAVSFRPTQDFDPITWTGEERPYRAGKDAGGRRGGREGGQQGAQQEQDAP